MRWAERMFLEHAHGNGNSYENLKGL